MVPPTPSPPPTLPLQLHPLYHTTLPKLHCITLALLDFETEGEELTKDHMRLLTAAVVSAVREMVTWSEGSKYLMSTPAELNHQQLDLVRDLASITDAANTQQIHASNTNTNTTANTTIQQTTQQQQTNTAIITPTHQQVQKRNNNNNSSNSNHHTSNKSPNNQLMRNASVAQNTILANALNAFGTRAKDASKRALHEDNKEFSLSDRHSPEAEQARHLKGYEEPRHPHDEQFELDQQIEHTKELEAMQGSDLIYADILTNRTTHEYSHLPNEHQGQTHNLDLHNNPLSDRHPSDNDRRQDIVPLFTSVDHHILATNNFLLNIVNWVGTLFQIIDDEDPVEKKLASGADHILLPLIHRLMSLLTQSYPPEYVKSLANASQVDCPPLFVCTSTHSVHSPEMTQSPIWTTLKALGLMSPEQEGWGCYKMYHSFPELATHLQSVIIPPKPFVCDMPDCNKSFQTADRLKEHLTVHIEDTDKPFKCRVAPCIRLFRNRKNRRNHEMTHNDERPHECPWEGCGKRFSRKDNMMTHYKLHEKRTEEGHDALFARGRKGARSAKMSRSRENSGDPHHTRQSSINHPEAFDGGMSWPEHIPDPRLMQGFPNGMYPNNNEYNQNFDQHHPGMPDSPGIFGLHGKPKFW